MVESGAARVIFAERALTPERWRADVRLHIAGGKIARVEAGVAAQAGDERHALILPAMADLHSHAFQRGMAGLAEVRGPGADSFWSWREVMYRFALTMTPDDVEAVAAQLYVEMLEAGFSRVGEFHYLHHDRDGRAYANIAEMAERIAAAADTAGIGLTLLPVFYAHSGFGGAPPNERQRRFINSLDTFTRLHEASRAAIAQVPGAALGAAPHSLRAVTPEELRAVAALAPGAPIHIHAAEQTQEVEDCLRALKARPVQWLLDNTAVDARWCLIHATHMDARETRGLAASGAVAGLCPVTEANLGDGAFNGAEFLAARGRFGIGSDSNIRISLAGELRQLEYSQRLAQRARNVLAPPSGSTGRALFDAALSGGAQALGAEAHGLCVGASADFLSLDAEAPALAGRGKDEILDAWIFAGGNELVDCVWARGKKQVQGGRHRTRGRIAQKFRAVTLKLRAQ